MATLRSLKRIRRWLLSVFYPNEQWLQPKPGRSDRYRRFGRRYSRHELPGPAYDVTIILVCAILAVTCLLM